MTNQPTIIESMRQAVPHGMKPDAKKAFYAAIGLLTSPCLKRPAQLPVFLVAALTMLTPAQAQEVSSLYTPLDLKKCKDVTPADAKEYGTIWRCEGYEGLSVRVAEGDLRIFVSYGQNTTSRTVALLKPAST